MNIQTVERCSPNQAQCLQSLLTVCQQHPNLAVQVMAEHGEELMGSAVAPIVLCPGYHHPGNASGGHCGCQYQGSLEDLQAS